MIGKTVHTSYCGEWTTTIQEVSGCGKFKYLTTSNSDTCSFQPQSFDETLERAFITLAEHEQEVWHV